MNYRPIPSVSIVMPTYNEAENIGDLILASVRSVRSFGVTEIEVIVVDDDSPDHTWRVAAATECPGATVRVLRRMQHHGLTPSLNEGIALAQHEVIVWLDCDFSQPPEMIPQMLTRIAEGFDVVVNSRYIPGGGERRPGEGGQLHLLLSRCLNRFLQLVLSSSFHDYTSGFVAARRSVLEKYPLRGDYGEYFVDFIYRVLRDGRSRVCELPYVMQPRRSGESKTGTGPIDYLKRGRKYLFTVMRLKFGW